MLDQQRPQASISAGERIQQPAAPGGPRTHVPWSVCPGPPSVVPWLGIGDCWPAGRFPSVLFPWLAARAAGPAAVTAFHDLPLGSHHVRSSLPAWIKVPRFIRINRRLSTAYRLPPAGPPPGAAAGLAPWARLASGRSPRCTGRGGLRGSDSDSGPSSQQPGGVMLSSKLEIQAEIFNHWRYTAINER